MEWQVYLPNAVILKKNFDGNSLAVVIEVPQNIPEYNKIDFAMNMLKELNIAIAYSDTKSNETVPLKLNIQKKFYQAILKESKKRNVTFNEFALQCLSLGFDKQVFLDEDNFYLEDNN